jgi:hypothetical protein
MEAAEKEPVGKEATGKEVVEKECNTPCYSFP